MILGHAATTLVARRAAPDMPWWLLLVSAVLIDIAMFTVVALGIETMEPAGAEGPSLANTVTEMTFSHDLVPQIGWTLLAGAIAFGVIRRRSFALIAMAVSMGHWLGDLVAGYGHHVFGCVFGFTRGRSFSPGALAGLYGLSGVFPFAFLVI